MDRKENSTVHPATTSLLKTIRSRISYVCHRNAAPVLVASLFLAVPMAYQAQQKREVSARDTTASSASSTRNSVAPVSPAETRLEQRKGKKGFASSPRARGESPDPVTVTRPRSPARTVPAKQKSEASERPRVEPRAEEALPTAPVSTLPDQIEVIEWGSRRSAEMASSVPGTRRQSTRLNVSTKRIEVEIDATRVMQIQQALLSRGFLAGEPTGIYDDLTVEAMRQFQISQKVDATGYPTAHSLKRLGL